ncbi:MAG: TetR/AcrR family transcriptional regulator [Planctomycetota bacterium]
MSTVKRRERERVRRKGDILDAARRLFWLRGYAGTTMPEIAQAAELAPGTLYLYFPSKSALYAELLLEGYDMLLERLQERAGRPASPRRQAEGLVEAFLEFAQEHPEYFDVIFFVLQKEGGGTRGTLEPEQLRRLQAREDACKAVALEVLRRADPDAAAGAVPTTVDAVWSMLVGTIFYFRHSDQQAFRSVAAEAGRLILDALFGKGQVERRARAGRQLGPRGQS